MKSEQIISIALIGVFALLLLSGCARQGPSTGQQPAQNAELSQQIDSIDTLATDLDSIGTSADSIDETGDLEQIYGE